jgi:hypothetical protein
VRGVTATAIAHVTMRKAFHGLFEKHVTGSAVAALQLSYDAGHPVLGDEGYASRHSSNPNSRQSIASAMNIASGGPISPAA